MLFEDLETAWLAHAAVVPIEPRITFKAQGLVLGAGTVLAANNPADQQPFIHLEAAESRLLALLSAAYGRPIGAESVGHIGRAVQSWNAGEIGLADVHLALTRLDGLFPSREAARRLFMADVLMEAGAQPDLIFSGLGFEPPSWETIRKLYNPKQPRVPAGNGRPSGQWARAASAIFQNLSKEALLGLARLAAGFPAAATLLGVLFIPTNKTSPEEEYSVPGRPGLRVRRLIGESAWRVIDGDNERTIVPGPDGALHDSKGQIVGRYLPNGDIAIDLAAVAPNSIHNNEPRYCPAPVKDNYGGGHDSIARAYEDEVKHFVNPQAPTPSGMAVALANLMKPGTPVKFDDCQHSSGIMIEAKGPTFTGLLRKALKSNFADSIDGKLLNQAKIQVQAAGPREVRWYFADKEAADHARQLFAGFNDGRHRIEIDVLPYVGKRK